VELATLQLRGKANGSTPVVLDQNPEVSTIVTAGGTPVAGLEPISAVVGVGELTGANWYIY
jgi:hypothetical protein